MYNQKTHIKKHSTDIMLSIIMGILVGCGSGDNTAIETPAVVQLADDNEEALVKDSVIVTSTTDAEIPVEVTVNDNPVSIFAADYTPDPEKLLTDASGSKELYVEPSFNFETYKEIVVEISAKDSFGEPLQGTMFTMSRIVDAITELDDQRLKEKSLIIKAFTNNAGSINISLEIPVTINTVLLELNTLGIENEVIYTLSDINKIVYNFN